MALGNHLLNLGQFTLRGQLDLVVVDRRRLTEQHGVHPVKCVARMSGSHQGTKPAERQHRCGHRSDHRQRAASALAGGQPVLQRSDGFVLRDQSARRRPSQIVAPLLEQRSEHLVVVVRDVNPLTGGERVEEPVAARDRVQRRLLCW